MNKDIEGIRYRNINIFSTIEFIKNYIKNLFKVMILSGDIYEHINNMFI